MKYKKSVLKKLGVLGFGILLILGVGQVHAARTSPQQQNKAQVRLIKKSQMPRNRVSKRVASNPHVSMKNKKRQVASVQHKMKPIKFARHNSKPNVRAHRVERRVASLPRGRMPEKITPVEYVNLAESPRFYPNVAPQKSVERIVVSEIGTSREVVPTQASK